MLYNLSLCTEIQITNSTKSTIIAYEVLQLGQKVTMMCILPVWVTLAAVYSWS